MRGAQRTKQGLSPGRFSRANLGGDGIDRAERLDQGIIGSAVFVNEADGKRIVCRQIASTEASPRITDDRRIPQTRHQQLPALPDTSFKGSLA